MARFTYSASCGCGSYNEHIFNTLAGAKEGARDHVRPYGKNSGHEVFIDQLDSEELTGKYYVIKK